MPPKLSNNRPSLSSSVRRMLVLLVVLETAAPRLRWMSSHCFTVRFMYQAGRHILMLGILFIARIISLTRSAGVAPARSDTSMLPMRTT